MLLVRSRILLGLLASIIAATTSARSARAEEVIKVGVLVEMSGPFAPYGKQITTGMKAYMKVHGDKAAGKRIELVVKDTTGPAPDLSAPLLHGTDPRPDQGPRPGRRDRHRGP